MPFASILRDILHIKWGLVQLYTLLVLDWSWLVFVGLVSLRRNNRKTMDIAYRITPERISKLRPGEIFVFGSNH